MPTLFQPKSLFFWGAVSCLALIGAFIPLESHAVTVGPAKLQISLDPGQTATGFLYLKNETSQKQIYYPSVRKFGKKPNGENDFPNQPADIAGWMQLPQSVELEAGEDEQVPFTLNAPLNAPPGGHFAVIWWSTAPPDSGGGNVAIVTRAGILVYLRVSGAITEKGHISSFSGPSRFAWGLPINFNLNFVNEGNVDATPQGNVVVTNMTGTVKADLPVNPYGAIILPGSSGSFNVPWQGKGFFFGVYKAALTLTYGESKQTATASYWFVIVSPWAGAIVILVILLLFVLPPLVRRYNRWIIERAKQ